MKQTLKRLVAIGLVAIAALTIAQEVRREFLAGMSGTGKGKAVWKLRDTATHRQAELQAEGERLAPNTSYSLSLGANAPITVTTNGLGAYRLSRRFNTADRPSIAAGDPATLTDANSNVVQSGFFQPK